MSLGLAPEYLRPVVDPPVVRWRDRPPGYLPEGDAQRRIVTGRILDLVGEEPDDAEADAAANASAGSDRH